MAATAPKMVSIGYHMPGDSWHIGAHHHDHCQMVVIAGGSEDVVILGDKFTASVSDVLLFQPGVAHEEWSSGHDPLETYFMNFEYPAGVARKWPLRSVDEQGRLRLLCSWLWAGRDASLPEARAAEEAFFHALVQEFIRLQGQEEDPLVASIRVFVRQNIASPITVDMLARHAGLSKFHFIRLYRTLTGRSPMQDVRMIRIGHARDMILTSSLPLKVIAPMAGLGEEISLYRLFRRHLKMTPGQLRRRAHR